MIQPEGGKIIVGDDPDFLQNGTAVVSTRYADIRVWDSLLSVTEINSLYASANGYYESLYSSGIIQAQHASFLTLDLKLISEYANDAAAAAGGVPIGGVYHNAGVLQVRLV